MAYGGGVTWRLGRPEGDERYPYLGAAGACLGGGTPLLERDGQRKWRVRPQAELERLFAIGYGEPCDLGTRMGGLTALAGALNRGEAARAAIALVHLRLPPLADAAAGERMALADQLLKAGYDPGEPRVPKGQSGGGQWSSGGDGAGRPTSFRPPHTPSGVRPTLEQIEPVIEELTDATSTVLQAHAKHYNVVHSLPRDAKPVVAPAGTVIVDPDSPTGKLMAPPRADYRQVYAAGLAHRYDEFGAQIKDMASDVATGGIYDFQRNPATRTFYSQYTNSSNYAVGVFMAGVGYARWETTAIAVAYEALLSSGYSLNRFFWIERGWDDAHKGLWK